MQAATKQTVSLPIPSRPISLLNYRVSGVIRNFDPKSLPGGVLEGIRVHPLSCGTFGGFCNSQAGSIIDPSAEVKWVQELNSRAREELGNGEQRLKSVLKSLKQSEALRKKVEKRIVEMRKSNRKIERGIDKLIGSDQ
jgi:hypothetical protein